MPPSTIDPKADVELIATFELACERAQVTRDQVAGLLNLKREQLYQQLRLQGHFSLTRLIRMRDDPIGRRFLREYWPMVAVDMGLPDVANALNVADAFQVLMDAIQVRMLDMVQIRMARAEIHIAEQPEQKRA